MPNVRLHIGGRHYDVHCQEGDEARLNRLAQIVDGKASEAHAAIGGVNEARQLVFAALMLADDALTAEERAKPSGRSPVSNGSASAINRAAERIEVLARSLEAR